MLRWECVIKFVSRPTFFFSLTRCKPTQCASAKELKKRKTGYNLAEFSFQVCLIVKFSFIPLNSNKICINIFKCIYVKHMLLAYSQIAKNQYKFWVLLPTRWKRGNKFMQITADDCKILYGTYIPPLHRCYDYWCRCSVVYSENMWGDMCRKMNWQSNDARQWQNV